MSAFQQDTPFDVDPNGAGGPVVAVKMAIVTALRQVLEGTSFSDDQDTDSNSIHVDMEYPIAKVDYPGVWVQFSFSKIEIAGIGHVTREPNDDDGNPGAMVRRSMYEGRVTLLIVGLTSMHRDRIADKVIMELAFASREEIPGVDSQSVFLDALDSYPYASVVMNTDSVVPGGQSITVGTPWDNDQLVYEDSYSFNIIGEFEQVRDVTGAYVLKRIDIVPELSDKSSPLGTWF